MSLKILKGLLHLVLSIRTTIWLCLALILLLLAGGFIMPAHEEFQSLHTTPLLSWLAETDVGLTWWLLGSVLVLSLLTANTLACSIESLIRKKTSRSWPLTISPQLIHAGFLFILLAHFFSAYDSFQGFEMVREGSYLPLPNGLTASFEAINADVDSQGHTMDWAATVGYYQGERRVSGGTIRPNEPSFYRGFGLYIKTVRPYPFPVALIQVSRDAGAPYALAGGLLFLAGMAALLILKIRRESLRD